jgi:hypothetical protein
VTDQARLDAARARRALDAVDAALDVLENRTVPRPRPSDIEARADGPRPPAEDR